MGIIKRTGFPLTDSDISQGPMLARVVNHLDPTYMGSLEVTVLREIPGEGTDESANIVVRYCSPFFGSTAQKFEGNDSANFDDVQKSYGFWMVPPDIGTTVMVMFVGGKVNQGFWFGCVPDLYQNYMTPGIAASQYSAITPEQEKKYGTKYLPVAEYHKRSRTMEIPKPDTFTKPIHPFADRLLQQGLLTDTIRGVTSSSARREVPSQVFGISTPGPVDQSPGGSPSKRQNIGFDGSSQVSIPVSRLGGTQFVMDDGDKDGQNELVRIRTRTGHQILLHNSSDLIYIANSKGTAWIELTSNGKIDMYAQDSVSIHTEQDFNFRADRDFNIEAGRNINIKANGGMQIESKDRFYLICDTDGKIFFSGSANLTAAADIKMQSGSSFNVTSGSDTRLSAAAGMNMAGETGTFISSGAAINLGAAGNIFQTASQIHLNGPAADAATNATLPDNPVRLDLFSLPSRSASAGWSNGKFYKDSNLVSIMQRVPTHEPWDQHENINPSQFSPSATNVQISQPIDGPSSPTAGGGSVPINTNPVAQPVGKNAKENEAYCQAIFVQSGVTDPIKLAAWMAQCRQESNFIWLKEFASGAEYEGRQDLGNTQSGDGVQFKGRGFIQCTGRNNYASMSKYFNQDFISNPELVEQIEWAAKSVVWFFNVYKASRTKTVNWDDVEAVTRIVNGGINGLANRKAYYAEYKAKFTSSGIQPSPNPVSSGG
jgi:predicted chitinase/uncharacterized protein (DUF2345 family)